jgi:CheY-like chemotaxis protein
MARLNRSKPSTGSTILVVDDDSAIVSTLEQILRHEGHTVLTAASGTQAIELCQTHSVHLMLLDYYMPGMTGEDVVRAVLGFYHEPDKKRYRSCVFAEKCRVERSAGRWLR